METRRNYEDYGRPRSSNSPAWAMVMVMVIAVAIFGAYLAPDILHAPGGTESAKGGQAPGTVRGTFQGKDTRGAIRDSAPAAAPAADKVQADIDKYNAAQEAQAAQQQAAPAAQPLPLNSAGEPVISQEQRAQETQSLNVALDEGMTAADAQVAAQRQAMYTAVAVQAPDVSYEDTEAMMHRDPCHVPRADPHTCAQGLYKPTPVN